MNSKSDKDKKKTEKVRSPYNQCITCGRQCSMSGLCMRQWPEFVKRRKEEAAKD